MGEIIMRKNSTCTIIGLLFVLINSSGCLNFESSRNIIVEIESSYSYNANGEIKVDGIDYCDAYSKPNNFSTYTIYKNELNNKKEDYTITLSLKSGGVTEEAIAYNVKEYVRFHVYGVTRETEYGFVEYHKIQVVEIS